MWFDDSTASDKDFSMLIACLKKKNNSSYPLAMSQIFRQARAVSLKTVFMRPESAANVVLSNIAGEAAEGMRAIRPKNDAQVLENKPMVNAINVKKVIQAAPVSGQPVVLKRTGCQNSARLTDDLKAHGGDTVLWPLTWNQKDELKGLACQ